ncbi:T9SS type A sorting domain-containing protein [Nonlabens xiamenensis]|uniref:T9SS type A sorting domain-containing protein n=1 Tax=Nonlabens xiamenensis TaxID=2341043 RepID=UPI000F611A01|nr:T9SS type A sorting domain-containing protein [Nonlabens xiamenensis]
MLKKILFLCCLLCMGLLQAQFWTETYSGFSTNLRGLSKFDIVDASVTWAVGYDGVNTNNNIQEFSKTVDGGVTWTAGNIDVGDTGLGIGNISALDAMQAYVSIYPRASGQQGGIWKTVDGGTTWTLEANAGFTSSASFLNIVHFFDATTGLAIGDPVNGFWEIYRTTNGGSSYSRVASSQIPAPLAGETGYIAQFESFGDNIWFTTSEGRIYHSVDKGASWNVYQSPINDFGGTTIAGDIAFATGLRGVIQDNSGNLYRTVDAGQTWNNIVISGVGTPYGGSIDYLPNTFFMVSTGGDPSFAGSSYSRDDGVTWINIDTEQHVDCAFLDDNTGFSGGFSNATAMLGAYRYTSTVLSNPDEALAQDFMVFPNPVGEQLNIQTNLSWNKAIVYDLNGRQVLDSRSPQIDVGFLNTGLYFIEISSDAGSRRIQFLKK